MFRKLLMSEMGSINLPAIMFTFAVITFVVVFIYANYINPPKKAEDLNISNSSVFIVPASQCEIRRILREGSPVSLTVVDENNRVVETVSEAKVSCVINDAVLIYVKHEDSKKIPPLSVNRLRLVLEPKG